MLPAILKQNPSATIADSELLSAHLRVENPEMEDNIVATIPDTNELPTIVADYNMRPEGGKNIPDFHETYIWCAHCNAKTHWNGYIARLQNGTGFLVGKDCGKKHYGIDFDEVEKVFKAQKDRQYYLQQLQKISPRMADVIVEMNSLRDSDAVVKFHAFRKQFSGAVVLDDNHTEHFGNGFGRLAPNLTNLIKDNNKFLCKVVHERDFEAEEREQEENAKDNTEYDNLNTTQKRIYHSKYGRPNRTIVKRFKKVLKNTSVLAGWELFDYSYNPRFTFQSLGDELRSIYASNSLIATQGVTTLKLSKLVKTIRGILKSTKEAVNALNAQNNFFDVRNLQAVVECLNTMDRERAKPFSVDGASLCYEDSNGLLSKISGGKIELPNCEVVTSLDELLSE